MLLIKSKWVLEGKQMLGEKVSDEWEEHLIKAGIKFERVTEAKRKTVSSKAEDI